MIQQFPGRFLPLARSLCLGLALAVTTGSCAYYNTFYLAKRYYDKGTVGLPYPVEKPEAANVAHFNKAITYSKKLLAEYPKHKLVDDAYLMWGKALLGVDDPRQTITLLEEFSNRFPNSPLKDEANFYLGVAYRQARKYRQSLAALDTFLVTEPKHRLAPYAHLERARALTSLERHQEAAQAADELIQRFPKSDLVDRARVARAEARFTGGAHDLARADYHDLGARARTDEERLNYLLREADCLEAARKYEEQLALLRDAIAHERAPVLADSVVIRGGGLATGTGFERYGKLLIRIGTAELLAGRQDKALDAYQRVVTDFRGTSLAAEAQYRLGYSYERLGDDFDRARAEYARVAEHGRGSSFVTQAEQRIANLDRLAKFRSAEGDSAEKRAEAGFLLAELYLFQLDKPERALDEYRKVASDFAGTPYGAKAMNAEAWVLSRKLKQDAAAESLFWAVVREYPATEAQIAARDYLEVKGVTVPSDLIKLPERQLARVDSLPNVEPPPEAPTALGIPARRDTASLFSPRPPGFVMPPGIASRSAIGTPPAGAPTNGAPTLAGEPPFPTAQNPTAQNPPRPGPPQASARPAPSPSPARRDTTAVRRAPSPARRDSTAAPRD